MTGDVATAEDVVQDAFEQLHRRWGGLRRPGTGLAYVRSGPPPGGWPHWPEHCGRPSNDRPGRPAAHRAGHRRPAG
jgi:hypothetical protein